MKDGRLLAVVQVSYQLTSTGTSTYNFHIYIYEPMEPPVNSTMHQAIIFMT